MEEEKKEEVVDALEFAPVKDILPMFGGEWQDEVAAIKKWDDKVAKLNTIKEACNNVKIKPGNVDGICAFLKKEASNSNVNISMAAISACAALAAGMQKDFAGGVKILVGPIFLKYKEKRPLILAEIDKFAEQIPKCTSIEEIKDEIVPLITNVAPGVKNGVVRFIEKTA